MVLTISQTEISLPASQFLFWLKYFIQFFDSYNSRHLNSNGDSPRGSTALSDTNTDGLRRDLEIKGEPVKTLLAGIFLVFAWVATTTSLALTHERVPEYKPLPDVILDNIKYQSWGLDASEIVIMIATLMAFAVSLFHKHR